MVCKKYHKNQLYLCFENLTMAPYCKALIDWKLLSKFDIDYINQYHKKVFDTLAPLLKDDLIALKYLEKECESYKEK